MLAGALFTSSNRQPLTTTRRERLYVAEAVETRREVQGKVDALLRFPKDGVTELPVRN